MRVRRYKAGQTNIDMLEAGARSIRSPALIARGEGAAGLAIAQASKSVAHAAMDIRANEKQLALREDATRAKALRTSIEIARKRWSDKWEGAEMTQPDGTPTSIAMREDWQEVVAGLETGLQNFTTDEARQLFQRDWSLLKEAAKLDTESEIMAYRREWDKAAKYDLFRSAIELGRPADARGYADELRRDGDISEDQFDALMNDVERAEIGAEADAEVKGLRAAYGVGGLDGAQAYFDELAKNPHDDPKTQRAIMSSVGAELNNLGVAHQTEEDMQLARWSMRVQDLEIEAELTGRVDPDALFEQWVVQGIPPKQAAAARNRIQTALVKALESNMDWMKTADIVERGGILDNTKKTRSSLDRMLTHLASNAEEGTDPLDLKVWLYKRAGLVGQTDYLLLNNYSTAEQLAAAALLHDRLKDDPYKMPNMGRVNHGELAAVARRAKDGAMTWQEAAQEMLDLKAQPPEVVQKHEQTFKNEDGIGKVVEAFNDLSDRDYDLSAWPGVSGVEGMDTYENKWYYTLHYQDGYKLFGDFDKAEQYANDMFMASHPITNINGVPEVMRGGLDMRVEEGVTMDWSILRRQFINDIASQHTYNVAV